MRSREVREDTLGKGKFLLDLYRKALTLPDQDLYDYFLDHAVNLTKSKIGFFHFVSNDQKTIALTTWNKEALKNCTANYVNHYPMAEAGNWADRIRFKRPIIYNDFKNSPHQKGLPKGHVPLKRMLGIPIIEKGKTKAIFGVGNKKAPYTQRDIDQLELIGTELNRIITQRRADAELLESKEKYQLLFENMVDGFAFCQMIYDKQDKPRDFICLEVNQAFERILRVKKEHVLGKKATEVFRGFRNVDPHILNTLGLVASTGLEEKFELFIEPLKIWLAASAYSPQRGYFAVIVEDITQRKKAEEALKESEGQLKRSQEIAHVGSWELDLVANKLVWTDEVYRIFGLKPLEFDATYETFLSCVHPDDREIVDKTFNASLDEGNDNYEIDHRAVRKDTGEIRFVHEKCSHIRDKFGEVIRSVGMVQDITERKKAEQALRESEERLQLKLDSVLSPDIEIGENDLSNIIDVPSLQATMDHLYEVTNMGFALIDLKGKVLVGTGWQDICTKFHRVNPRTCKNCIESDIELSSGLKKGQISLYKCKNNMWDVVTPLFIGDKHVGNVFFGQFFFDDEVPNRELFAAQAEKYGFNKEEYLAAFDRIPRFSRKSIQELMVFYSRFSELVSKISHSNLKLAKNLNLQKELQEKLEDKAAEVEEYASQMEKLAEERARKLKDAERLSAIGATAGMVGHDIRNPLQAITGDIYLARLEIAKLPDNTSKQSMEESMLSIEENILYINKIVADLQDFAKPLNPRREQVNLSKAITDALAMVVVPKNIKVTINSDEKITALTADSTMIKRILVNLAQNAVQAMPKGGKLTITTTTKRHGIEIAIQDTGEGIPQEVQSKLFTPLMTTKSKGQGFGLAVVKRMTEAMGGTVTFETESGTGTKFILKFPA
ncbi:MAG: PocR ligand-binding domain-containing protein [Candidatus Bathyarchaeota archaeon]|nr:PocR ligand-binding domain-containing protein [Candidatus Bathyarchaeota archaeon]